MCQDLYSRGGVNVLFEDLEKQLQIRGQSRFEARRSFAVGPAQIEKGVPAGKRLKQLPKLQDSSAFAHVIRLRRGHPAIASVAFALDNQDRAYSPVLKLYVMLLDQPGRMQITEQTEQGSTPEGERMAFAGIHLKYQIEQPTGLKTPAENVASLSGVTEFGHFPDEKIPLLRKVFDKSVMGDSSEPVFPEAADIQVAGTEVERDSVVLAGEKFTGFLADLILLEQFAVGLLAGRQGKEERAVINQNRIVSLLQRDEPLLIQRQEGAGIVVSPADQGLRPDLVQGGDPSHPDRMKPDRQCRIEGIGLIRINQAACDHVHIEAAGVRCISVPFPAVLIIGRA